MITKRKKRSLSILAVFVFLIIINKASFASSLLNNLGFNSTRNETTASETDSATVLTTPVPDPSSTETEISASQSPKASIAPEPSPSALPQENQKILFRIPNSLLADPRAHSLRLPQMYVSSSNLLLLCVDVNNGYLSFGNKNTVNDNSGAKFIEVGNGTSTIRISGSDNQINRFLNSTNGVLYSNSSNTLNSTSITFRALAVSKSTIEDQLCDQSETNNSKFVQVKPLGISLDTKKGEISLKKQ